VNIIWDEVDDLIAGFIRSLLNVSLILIIYYTICLSLIGFEFAVLFGVISGICILVPFVGFIVAFSSCLAMSLLIHGFDYQQLFIMIIYSIGQVLDTSVLTPQIVGDKIGLHPAAIVFAVLVGGETMGIAGLFLGIPIAGMIKIIFKRFVLTK
jgi:predicted PurR-regulated permease PerM